MRALRGAARALGLAAAAWSAFAWADVEEIRWDAQGRHGASLSVAPGKFAEVCGRLARGSTVQWHYRTDAPLDFNIHYHVGKEVRMPARRAQSSEAQDRLAVERDQDYCWMWTNKGTVPVTLEVELMRL